MGEIARQSALGNLALSTPQCAAATLRVMPAMARLLLRCRPDGVGQAGRAMGFDIPQSPCRAAGAMGRFALWLGPDEWLLIAPDAELHEIADQLSRALESVPHSLVDVSHRNAALEIDGPKAEFLLNHGCPLDLSLDSYPVGTCSRTLFAKAEIVLWRTDTECFRIETGRSFAPYVWRFLAEARREFE